MVPFFFLLLFSQILFSQVQVTFLPGSPGYSSKLPSMAPFFFLLLFSQILVCTAVDTINSTTPLSGTQTIVSKGNKFALGFYSPQQGNTTSSSSSNYYIAIWYSNIPLLTTVWTANNDVPVSDPTTASLAIGSDGNLVLLDQSKNRQLWSTNVSIASNSTVAIITDEGSLDLTDASNSSIVYWRSIEHPTNTWLPGGKLGLNKTTRVSQRLVAWKNNVDPSPGLFSLELDPNGTTQYFTQWNNSISYWTSGPWNGNAFSLVPEMTISYKHVFHFVNNGRESYFMYSMQDNSMISRLIIDVDGQIKQLTWVMATQQWFLLWAQPPTPCEVYAFCGPYVSCNLNGNLNSLSSVCNCIKGFSQKVQRDWDLGDYRGGCKRNVPLQCQMDSTMVKTEADKFYTIEVVRLPDNAQNAEARSSQDCQVVCLNNCSCNAYAYNSSGCFVWHVDLVNLQEQYYGNGSTLFLRLAASEIPVSEKTRKRKVVIICALVIGGIVVLTIFASVLYMLIQRCYRERALRISNRDTLISFQYSDLKHVTKNFAEKLGGGAFGSVFKGRLPDSTFIAVKRLERLLHGEKQFRAEVSTIGLINHVNLVRLLGFCAEETRRLLVYEYMQGGSLDFHLFRKGTTFLDWNARYKIALGVAKGLAYLHEECRECIIHCDLKPENILLDANFHAKVADFGMAKLLGHDYSRVLTTMRGTIGYLAPEWLSGLAITPKIDVYSFGMVLFELISGRRNLAHFQESEIGSNAFLPCWAAMQVTNGNEQNILDPILEGAADREELMKISRLACWCIQDFEAHRPSMGLVVKVLEGSFDVSVPPLPRTIQHQMEGEDSSPTD